MPTAANPYKAGYCAALRGDPLDACRYRKPDRRNDWVRGWHQGQADKAMEPLSPEERATGRARIQEVKQLLDTGRAARRQEWISRQWGREKDRRFYSVYLQPDLFGTWVLISVWGRRGTELGRIRHTPCASYKDGLARIEAIGTRRRQHGYIPLTPAEVAMPPGPQRTAGTATVDEAS